MKTERPRVLLVEDNPGDIRLAKEMFKEAKLKLTLTVAEDGVQAMDYLNKVCSDPRLPKPELIILDLNLPKGQGEAVLERVRSSPKYGAAKVFIISSSGAPRDRERAMKLGANDYFRKPSNLAQFMELGPRVRAMLEGDTSAKME